MKKLGRDLRLRRGPVVAALDYAGCHVLATLLLWRGLKEYGLALDRKEAALSA